MSSGERKTVRRVALDAVFLVLALALSYIEVLIPFGALVPLPGFKLGLANILVMLLVWRVSVVDGAIVSFLRVLIMGVLFGTPISMFFSAGGALLSFLVLILLNRTADKFISFVGISVLSAAAHNMGQLICAGIVFDFRAVLTYLPLLLVASAIFGTVSGVLINRLYPHIEKIPFERVRI